MSVSLEGAKPFFSRQATKNAISTLANCDRLVLYAGAGVTIDRSSIGWRELVSSLMETYVHDVETRDQLLNVSKDLMSASTAVRLYQNDHGIDYRNRLTDKIRVTLYNSEDWRVGALATNLVNLMLLLNQRQIDSKGADAPGTCIVTPNYDDYIWSELQHIAAVHSSRRVRKRWSSQPQLYFPTKAEPLGQPGKPRSAPSAWLADKRFPEAQVAPCVHLHGFVPRSHSGGGSQSDMYRHPVVSGQDYFDTSENSYGALVRLFGQSSVLIVGASMTDPPMLQALADTAEVAEKEGYARYALVTMESSLDITDKTELQRLLKERYVHFGVIPVFLDYYGQVSQFVHEVTVAASLEDPWEYDASDRRYGRRLVGWWKRWIASVESEDSEAEFVFHDILQMASIAVASILEAAADEKLKVEFWVRWAPKTQREVRLWATSIGTLTDEDLMRHGELQHNSDYTSVRALLAGRPVLEALEDGQAPDKRWRTHLSIPIRVPVGASEIPVGAITLASMSPRKFSALDPAKNKDLLLKAIQMLTDLGVTLSTPSVARWDRYYESLTSTIFGE